MQARHQTRPPPQPEADQRGAKVIIPAQWRVDPRADAAERAAILAELATEAGQRRFLALVEGRRP